MSHTGKTEARVANQCPMCDALETETIFNGTFLMLHCTKCGGDCAGWPLIDANAHISRLASYAGLLEKRLVWFEGVLAGVIEHAFHAPHMDLIACRATIDALRVSAINSRNAAPAGPEGWPAPCCDSQTSQGGECAGLAPPAGCRWPKTCGAQLAEAAVREEGERKTPDLRDRIEALLMDFRLQHTLADDGADGAHLPLVDAISPPFAESIKEGKEEIHRLADYLASELQPLEGGK